MGKLTSWPVNQLLLEHPFYRCLIKALDFKHYPVLNDILLLLFIRIMGALMAKMMTFCNRIRSLSRPTPRDRTEILRRPLPSASLGIITVIVQAVPEQAAWGATVNNYYIAMDNQQLRCLNRTLLALVESCASSTFCFNHCNQSHWRPVFATSTLNVSCNSWKILNATKTSYARNLPCSLHTKAICITDSLT